MWGATFVKRPVAGVYRWPWHEIQPKRWIKVANWKGRDMVRDHKIIGIESNNQVLNYGIEIKYKNRKTYRKRDKRNKKL